MAMTPLAECNLSNLIFPRGHFRFERFINEIDHVGRRRCFAVVSNQETWSLMADSVLQAFQKLNVDESVNLRFTTHTTIPCCRSRSWSQSKKEIKIRHSFEFGKVNARPNRPLNRLHNTKPCDIIHPLV